MIIYCEECGAKNILPDTPGPSGEKIKCRFCKDNLVIHHGGPTDQTSEDKPVALSRLLLKHQNTSIEHCGPGRQIRMGRHESNDIRVQDERASRLHAIIEYKHGKFCLTDQSLNGTFILVNNREGRTIRHKEIMLVNQGLIGLGGKVDENSPNAIHYSIQSP